MIYYGLYDPDDVLVDVFSTVDKAVGAAPRGVSAVVGTPSDICSATWKVYEVQITEAGISAKRIEQILGHPVGINTPAFIQSL